MLRILIADDHAIVRKGLREILREASEATVVGEASDGSEAINRAKAEPWDVIVLDITMPGMNGIEVLKRLKQEQPALPVLMLSMHSGLHYVRRSLEAGASGYLSKETAPEELVAAIRQVLAGQRYLSHALARELASELGEHAGNGVGPHT